MAKLASEETSMSDHESDHPVDGPERFEHPVDVPGNVQRDTLIQKADDEEGSKLTWEEFQELSHDPKLLYKEVTEVMSHLKEMNERYYHMRDRHRKCQAELRKGQAELRKSEATIEGLLAQQVRQRSETPSASTKVVRLPDPPMFSGQQDKTPAFDDWIVQIKNKLRGNADWYPTEELKVIYVASRLEGNALSLVTPRLDTDNHHAYQNIKDLLEHLKELYADPNKVRNARYTFKDLYMKKGQTFQEFYGYFLRLVADGNITSDLKDDLNDKLSYKLQEAVAMYFNDPAVTTTVFAQHCTTLDQQIRTRTEKQERSNKRTEQRKKLASTPIEAGGSSVDKDNKKPQTYRNDGKVKCFNCNEFGHMAKECKKPMTDRTRAVLARISLASDSGSEDEESENDDP
jgi:Zinc knuckle